ncbi:MAG: MerR family transcriptional regulator, partial [Spirochaetia bacterium]|nr:MerR family transcriptional regulator [Spirochaetia bacterium]
MDYLVKELAAMTGIPSHAIRKWQERYGILKPMQAQNGYWRYSNEDYFVLKSIQQRLADNQRLQEIMRMGRETLLEDKITNFSQSQTEFIGLVQAHSYDAIEKQFNKKTRGTFSSWINRVIRPSVVLVGKAWETGLLSIPDEHGYSKWLQAYLFQKVQSFTPVKKAGWLCVTFPDDPHELSSLMHYAVLRSRGLAAWFCGMLPREILLRELQTGKYSGVAISVVLNQTNQKKDALARAIEQACPGIRVRFGG